MCSWLVLIIGSMMGLVLEVVFICLLMMVVMFLELFLKGMICNFVLVCSFSILVMKCGVLLVLVVVKFRFLFFCDVVIRFLRLWMGEFVGIMMIEGLMVIMMMGIRLFFL